jgi:RimJ/RimL family protein N-acetyltransferase
MIGAWGSLACVTADTSACTGVAYVVGMDVVRLGDGTELSVRPIRPDDRDRLQHAHLRLSPEAQYRRFLAPKPRLTTADVRYLTDVDGYDHYALVAAPIDDPDSIVAVGRFVRLDEGSRAAELAIVVGDPLHGQGLATELVARLADAAQIRGVDRFRATILADNVAVRRLLWRLSQGKMRSRELGSISELEVELPTRAPRGSDSCAWRPRPCNHRGVPWRLTVRVGPRVQRSRFERLEDALEALERRAGELAREAPGDALDMKFRRFEPTERVAARIELAGPQRLIARVRGGLDVRGDGSTQAYLGRVRRQEIEQHDDENASAALRRALT